MAGVKISNLSTVTPLSTDLVVLDRPATGPGAPVTGKATLASLATAIGGTGGDQYWFSTQNLATYTTSSALFRGPAGTNNSPNDFGPDIFFFVSGTKASKETAVTGTAVFGGDVVISGSYYLGSDNSSITPFDFSVPLTQVGLLSTNRSSLKRSQYSTIQSSNGVEHEATSYSSIRSSFYPSPSYSGLYLTNYCTLDSSYSGFAQFSDYSSMIASNGPNIAGSSYSLVAASLNTSGPTINGSAYSTTIATSNGGLAIQGFSRSAIIGGVNNLLNAGTGFPSLNSSIVLGGKNWTIQEGDTIAMGAASGGSTRLLVSASAGMYLGGNLQVTGNIAVSQLMSIGQSLQVIGLMGVTGSAEFLGGVTGSLHYSASNAVDWNNNAPVTIAEALNRIAAFINSNIGPIT